MADKRASVQSKCDTCSQEVLGGLLFCTNCGAPTEIGKSEPQTAALPCPNCQAIDSMSRSFCVSCGSRVDTVDARDRSRALSKRSGLNWRSNAVIAARAPNIITAAPPQVTRHPETVAIPALLGIVCGAALVAAVILWGDSSLNYALARAASPRHGLVVFVRVPDKTGFAAGFLAKQPHVKISLLPLKEPASKKGDAGGATSGAQKSAPDSKPNDTAKNSGDNSKASPPAGLKKDSNGTSTSTAPTAGSSKDDPTNKAKADDKNLAKLTGEQPDSTKPKTNTSSSSTKSDASSSTATKTDGSSPTKADDAPSSTATKTDVSSATKTDPSSSTIAKTDASTTTKTAPASSKTNGTSTSTAAKTKTSAQTTPAYDPRNAPAQDIKAETDDYGMLTIPDLAGGRYKITLEAQGCYSAAATITVKDDTETIVGWPQPIELVPSDDG
jgi:hypothetical protein